jgi:hypothetical protein
MGLPVVLDLGICFNCHLGIREFPRQHAHFSSFFVAVGPRDL